MASIESNDAHPGGAVQVQELEGHQGAVYDLCRLPDGALASVGGDGFLVRWNRDGDRMAVRGEAQARSDAPLFALCALPDGGVRMGNAEGEVIDVVGEGQWTSHRRHEGPVSIVLQEGSGGVDGCWLGDGETVPLIRVSGRIRAAVRLGSGLWIGTSDGEVIHQATGRIVQAHEGAVRAILAWPDKAAMATAGADGRLRLWKHGPDGGLQPVVTLDAHRGAVYRAEASPDGRWVATASRDRSVAVWNAANLELQVRLVRPAYPGHRRSVNALCWLDEHRLATAGDDGRILLWTLPG